MVIVCDIDGTITVETAGHEYRRRTPRLDRIKVLQELKKQGNTIHLQTARRLKDSDATVRWLEKYKVPCDELTLEKPLGDVYVDDKTRSPEEFFGNNRVYNFHKTCWRHTFGHVSPSEVHECFFCADKIPLTTHECAKCGIMICPSCHNCLCSISPYTYDTLVRIHSKYCCDLPNFEGKIELDGIVDMGIIKRCETVLQTCFDLEFKK